MKSLLTIQFHKFVYYVQLANNRLYALNNQTNNLD